MTDDKAIEAALDAYKEHEPVGHYRYSAMSAALAAADKVRAERDVFDYKAEAKRALRCGECDLPEGPAECLCQQVINDMVEYGRRAYTAGAAYGRALDDGSCQRCGAIPRDANGLCATCRDELEEWRVRESETQEELQKLGEEFGVYGGEPRVSGIRRILAEQHAGLAKGEADRAALREAREEIAIQRCHYAVSSVAWKRSGKIIDRIDAALSAASGEASRPTIYERDGVFDDYQGPDNPAASGEASDKWEIDAQIAEAMGAPIPPAPSEAPNVERAGKLTDEQLREWIEEHERAPWITDKKKHPQNIYGARLLAILKDLRALRARIAELEAQLERQITAAVSADNLAEENYSDLRAEIDSARAEGIAAMRECAVKIVDKAEPALFHRVAAAIREAKP